MGFMDYTLVGSDEAADMVSAILKAQLKKLSSCLRTRTNEYNTPGFMNVAMFIREVLMKQVAHLKTWDSEGYIALADGCLERLNLELERLKKMEPDTGKNQRWLRQSRREVRRMIRAVTKFKRALK